MLVFISEWQTLIGAVIGGVFALSVALLVAYKARRHEDMASAMLVVSNLANLQTSESVLHELASDQGITAEQLPLWFTEKLIRRRIKLSPLFESSRIRLMPIDVKLAVHLEMFQTLFNDIEEKLEVLSKDLFAIDNGLETRSQDLVISDANVVYDGIKKASQHANCAKHLLTLKVLSRFPTFHTIRMLLLKTEQEKYCEQQLS